MARFPDWTAHDAAGRDAVRAAARRRAHALEPRLNAFALITPEPERTTGCRPLAGLPVAVKDLLHTPTRLPTCGLSEPGTVTIDGVSDLPGRLEMAGADVVGYTNMTELAYEPSGINAARGAVHNPWSLDHISGGSSSGSAAAVASGSVIAAIGSDTGGSLRIPAHACGVTAWKPTSGAVPASGAMPLAPSLDTIGLMARSADDMMPLVPLMADLPARPAVVRVVMLDDVIASCDPTIGRAVSALAEPLAALDVVVDRRPALPAIDEIDRHALVVLQGESARTHRRRLADPAIDPALRRRLAKGLEISDVSLAHSVAARPRLLAAFEREVLGAGDVAILPVMAITTPRGDDCDPASKGFSPRTLYALSALTRFVNMLGCPALALPIGFDAGGLPIAAQVVGRPGDDLALLDLVRRIQAITDWHGRVPAAVADLST